MSDEQQDILLDEELEREPAPPRTGELLPYDYRHRRAQRYMAMVRDPEGGGILTKNRVAELCGVDRTTLHRWINDPARGGKLAWYAAVDGYVKEMLEDKWALLVRIQVEEALKGKAKIGAFRNVARVLGRLGPDVEIKNSAGAGGGAVVIVMPDNGRIKATCPDAPGQFAERVAALRNNGGNGNGNDGGDDDDG